MEGVDYAFSNPTAVGLAAAGKKFAMRYVGPGTSPKHLTVAESETLQAAGLLVVLLVEGAADSAKGGRTMGQQHARLALDMCKARGFPTDRPFYMAVDYDVASSSWPAAANYLRGAGDVLGPNLVGVYGEYDVMVWAARDKVASWFFQTYAWSSGRWFAGNHVEQYHNGVNMAGGVVDLCRSMKTDFGQWPTAPQGGNVMAVIVQWPPEVKGSLCFSNGDGLHHIPSVKELDQIHAGWPGIQTVDATKWAPALVHKLYGPDGAPWGADPDPVPVPGEAEMEAIAERVARDTVAASTLTPPSA